jgi:uncharacterized protein (TIGR02246 family)
MFKRTISMAMVSALLVACGGDSADEAAPAEEMEAGAEAMAGGAAVAVGDEEALDDLATYWETHYNMGHADMVASVYTEDAVALPASGNVFEGRAAIEADLAAGMASSPQATINSMETMIFGDMAVGIGTYSISASPEGAEAMAWSGAYMNLVTKVDGEWKIAANLSNYDAPPPLDWPWDTYEGEVPEDAGTLAELVDFYESHYNMGHAAEVSSAYTEGAMAAFADNPFRSGTSEIQAQLQTNIDTGAIVTIHDVMTQPLGDGWAVDAGWYQLNASDAGDPVRYGNYMNLVQQQEDGTWKIHWMVTNGWPAAAQEAADRLP